MSQFRPKIWKDIREQLLREEDIDYYYTQELRDELHEDQNSKEVSHEVIKTRERRSSNNMGGKR